MTVNKVLLIGNLGADPETRTAQSGTSVCNLRLATTERRKDRDGNWTDHTEWHRVVCFGKTAENASRYLKKGRQIYVEGSLRTSKYQDKQGIDRWSTEIFANDIRFLGGGPRDSSTSAPHEAPQDREPYGYEAGGGAGGGGGSMGGGGGPGPGGGDDDIPF